MVNEFIEYLKDLAPEGETMLFTKKVPSGAFPAFLPSQWTGRGAWYGNTGSYIIDRFQGELSASAKNIEYVLCLICDDVGTKSKTPPLPPTWIMETSAGNFQWGYGFSEQPTKGAYSAAIKAIAAAGYSDPGAINPVRNFRLPGSMNKTKGNFKSVLVEFHPEREYTLDEIVAAFGVTPGPVEADRIHLRLTDDGGDIVLAWLRDNGHLLDSGNAAGWYGVVCPNASAHTDGSLESRYTPATRSWCCMHGHCQHLKSKDFLTWVYEAGGPDTTTGLREELLASVMQGALAKLGPPTEAYPGDQAEKINEGARLRELARLDRASWHGIYAYIEDDDAYFDMVGCIELKRATFNALYRGTECRSKFGAKSPRIEASIWFDQNRNDFGGYTLRGLTYAAGETPLVHRDGLVYGNLWRNARPVAGNGDVSMWLAHCRSIVPDDRELSHCFDVMAHKLQRPNVKINHAVLHGGRAGCGKDTMWAPFLWAIGGDARRNVSIVSNETLTSTWGYDLESEVMVVNELRQTEASDRRALENRLKPIIAAPPEYLPVNRKGLHPYMMLNRTFVFAMSNDSAAISLPSDDRRWFVMWSEAPKMTPDAAQRIWSWYKAGGFAAVAGWLMRRDVSAFNPGASPMVTEAKLNMIESGRSLSETFLVDALKERKYAFARGAIMAPFHSLCDSLGTHAPYGYKVSLGALMHALQEAEWVDLGRSHTIEHKTVKRLFACPEVARDMSKSDIRRMLEEPVGTKLSAVK